jgi:hypothetical protein
MTRPFTVAIKTNSTSRLHRRCYVAASSSYHGYIAYHFFLDISQGLTAIYLSSQLHYQSETSGDENKLQGDSFRLLLNLLFIVS